MPRWQRVIRGMIGMGLTFSAGVGVVARDGDLVAPHGHPGGGEGVLDALRGTTTEKVVRQSPVPVLAVPKAWIKREAGWLHDTRT